MKKLTISILSLFLCTLCFSMVGQTVYAECPPPGIEELFEKKENLGELMLYAVPETEQSYINHIKYLYNRFLVRDTEGKIRQAIAASRPVIIVMEDGEDLDEVYREYGRLLKNCPIQEFLIVETVPLGTDAEKLGVRDATIEEMLNLIYYYGIYKAYPSWSKRLKKAMSRAISAGTFNPYVADPEQPREYWEVTYLGLGLEVYYNIWAKEQSVREGGYKFTTRETMEQGDPELFQLIEEIFPKNLYQ